MIADSDAAGERCTEGMLVDQQSERVHHGVGRVLEHAVLGPLPNAEMVSFFFDGVAIEGRRGEPIAAALLAAGVRVLRTMPRFGEPRGGYCMVGRCPDCLMVVAGVPNVRVCVTPVSSGLVVRTQHGLGEAEMAPDIGSGAG